MIFLLYQLATVLSYRSLRHKERLGTLASDLVGVFLFVPCKLGIGIFDFFRFSALIFRRPRIFGCEFIERGKLKKRKKNVFDVTNGIDILAFPFD